MNTSGSLVVMGISTARGKERVRLQGHLEGNSGQIQLLLSPPGGVGSVQRLWKLGTVLAPSAGWDGFGIVPSRTLSLLFNQVE